MSAIMSSEHYTSGQAGHIPLKSYVEVAPGEVSINSSAGPSRRNSPEDSPLSEKRGRVRFTHTDEPSGASNQKSTLPPWNRSTSPATIMQPQLAQSTLNVRNSNVTNVLRRSSDFALENPFDDQTVSSVLKPRSSLARNHSKRFTVDLQEVEDSDENEKTSSALAAQERAQRVATLVESRSGPSSHRSSFEEDYDLAEKELQLHSRAGYPVRNINKPFGGLDTRRLSGRAKSDGEKKHPHEVTRFSTSEAQKLVGVHTGKPPIDSWVESSSVVSRELTPIDEKRGEDYVPRPQQYRTGVLSSLLKLYNAPVTRSRDSSPAGLLMPGTSSSGKNTPRRSAKWYHHKTPSQDTLSRLMGASAVLGAQADTKTPVIDASPGGYVQSSEKLNFTRDKVNPGPRLEDEVRITVHIAETLSRQEYLLKLCSALMSYGAPTHRLEEYMRMSARVLEIQGQFLYMPGCMIVSFDDFSTHTTEVKLVRTVQGVNLGLLKDIHEIYKEVVHDVIGVEEATQRLDEIAVKKPKHGPWFLVFIYGLTSASVAPFAFQGRYIDMPVCFLLGCILGFLQLIVAPKSEFYNNVFEISAAVLTSFLARAFGSIRGGSIFCFSALAQSSIALILPGYMVLCGSLELQSRSMVAGSVRMVYAIIYSLFLGFGIAIGTAFYGIFDANATTATTCAGPAMSQYEMWPFVPICTLCLCIINQAKWKQTPVMLIIAFAGYIVNFFSAKRFPTSAQISNTLGALAVGVLGNLYSRMRHGVAAAALLPAIFVQVPSGLAASGSLLAGLSTAEEITHTMKMPNGTILLNGTSSVAVTSSEDLNTIVFNVGYSMIQIAIGITLGLFLSVLIVYPFGKRRSGLFSF